VERDSYFFNAASLVQWIHSNGDGRRHQTSVCIYVKQFFAIGPPPWLAPARGGHLPRSARSGVIVTVVMLWIIRSTGGGAARFLARRFVK